MSQVLTESPKHCAKQGLNINYKHYKKLFYAFSTFFLSVLSFIFLVWLILHPSKPDFSLQETDINQLNFNLSGSHLLNSSFQFTFLSINPNKKVGIYYDELKVYASHKDGPQIPLLQTSLPSFYQGHEERNVLTASLVGTGLPRATVTGKLVLSLRVTGKLRWKVGTWVSGRYRFNVKCVAIMEFGSAAAPSPSPSVPLSSTSEQGTQCSTAV
ncbi:hypothetical protein U1Q18_042545 [Sarracenia purpurea var. burkii]